jgi:proline racemase
MTLNQILGIVVLVVAYGGTWYLLLKSTKIVNTIDQEGLQHTREIKSRLKNGNGGKNAS